MNSASMQRTSISINYLIPVLPTNIYNIKYFIQVSPYVMRLTTLYHSQLLVAVLLKDTILK